MMGIQPCRNADVKMKHWDIYIHIYILECTSTCGPLSSGLVMGFYRVYF